MKEKSVDGSMEELEQELSDAPDGPGGPNGEGGATPVPPNLEDLDLDKLIEDIGPENFAQMAIEAANNWCIHNQLKPLNDLQCVLVKKGLSACLLKWKIDTKAAPEWILAAGILWVIYDKYNERKKLLAEKAPEKEPA